MKELNLSFIDLESMPMEYIEWFYDRQLKYKMDLQKNNNKAG
jgi:hypothetical protein